MWRRAAPAARRGRAAARPRSGAARRTRDGEAANSTSRWISACVPTAIRARARDRGARRLRARSGAREQHDVHAELGADPLDRQEVCSARVSVGAISAPCGLPRRRGGARTGDDRLPGSDIALEQALHRDVRVRGPPSISPIAGLLVLRERGTAAPPVARDELSGRSERLRDRVLVARAEHASWEARAAPRGRAGALPLPPRRDRTGNERPRGHRAGSAPRPRQARGEDVAACSRRRRRARSSRSRARAPARSRVDGREVGVARASSRRYDLTSIRTVRVGREAERRARLEFPQATLVEQVAGSTRCVPQIVAVRTVAGRDGEAARP